jgi:hypothetical protein
VSIKGIIFWDVMSCSMVEICNVSQELTDCIFHAKEQSKQSVSFYCVMFLKVKSRATPVIDHRGL